MIHTAITVRVFTADDIAERLKPILSTMDRAEKRAQGGHSDMHNLYAAAASDLHDLIAEVSE